MTRNHRRLVTRMSIAVLVAVGGAGCGVFDQTKESAAESQAPGSPDSMPASRPGSERRTEIPDGPKHVLASGEFTNGEWGDYQGEPWRFVAWGDAEQYCHSFEVGEPQGREGVSCSIADGERGSADIVGPRTYDPGSEGIPPVTYGEVVPEAARVQFRLTTGDVVDVDVIEPEDEWGLPVSYYLGFIPFSDNGEILVFDEEGKLLDRVDLCNNACGGTNRRYVSKAATAIS